MRIVSRQEAKRLGETRYFTGKLCRRGHSSDRYVVTCHCCMCDIDVGKKFYAENPERMSAYTKKYRAVEASKQRQANYHSEWERKNPEKVKAIAKKYRANNARTLAIKQNRRRARKVGSKEHHTLADVAEILKMQRSKCAYCKIVLSGRKWHVDHIQPLSAGGSNGRSNIQILCKPCNLSKSARDPMDFMRSRGALL